MEKPTWAEDVGPVGVYYDDATAVVKDSQLRLSPLWHNAIPATATITGWQREDLRKEPE